MDSWSSDAMLYCLFKALLWRSIHLPRAEDTPDRTRSLFRGDFFRNASILVAKLVMRVFFFIIVFILWLVLLSPSLSVLKRRIQKLSGHAVFFLQHNHCSNRSQYFNSHHRADNDTDRHLFRRARILRRAFRLRGGLGR